MCALFGWLDCGGKLPHKLLKKFTQSLANAAEERGVDASGISYIANGEVKIYKKPKPAHKMKFNFPSGTHAVMGHTRFTTQGSQTFNFNNHPFQGKVDKDFAFAHNGVLYNDKALRKEKKLPDTHIETDSYVAVQLLELQGKLDFNSLKSMAEYVEGNFTFTVLDEENRLYFVKGTNPLFLIYFEKLELYVYASTETIMTNALEKVGLEHLHYQIFNLNEGDMLSIDKHGNIEKSKFEPCLFLGSYGLHYADYYTNHEEMLLDVCNYFGVSEDDVLLLLDYGFTADDIEDMMMDSNLLEDTIADIRKIDAWEDSFEFVGKEVNVT